MAFRKFGNEISEVQKILRTPLVGNMSATNGYAAQIANISNITQTWSTKNTVALLTREGLDAQLIKSILITKGVSDAEAADAINKYSSANATDRLTSANVRLNSTFGGLSNTFKGLFATLKLNPMMPLLLVATTVITVFQSIKRSQQEAIQAAQQAAQEYESAANSIKEYTNRFQELHEALIQANGDQEETYTVKKNLLALQTELNEKYGDEYGHINLLTGAYEDQIEAIKQLNKQTAQTFLNENYYNKGKNAIKKMEDLEHYNLSAINIPSASKEGIAIKEIAAGYEKNGVKVRDDQGDGTYSLISIHLDANAKDAEKTINSFMIDLREKAKELGDEDLFSESLSINTDSLQEVKSIIENNGETYDQTIQAIIMADDTLSAEMYKATGSVDSFNKALAASSDPYNDENVTNAYNNLKSVRAEIEANEKGLSQYGNVVEEVFSQAPTAILDYKDKISTNKEVSSLVDEIKGMKLSDTDLLGIDFEDSVESKGEEAFGKILKLLDISKGEVKDFAIALSEIGVVQKDIQNNSALPNTDNYENIIKKLKKMKEPLDALDAAYSKIADNGELGFDELNSIGEQFSIVPDYEKYLDILVKSRGDAAATQQVFNDLSSAYINQQILNDLTEENAELISGMLEENGVANANEIVLNQLNAQKEYSALSSANLAGNLMNEVAALVMEDGQLSASELALAQYTLKKETANGISLNTTGDINNLLALVEGCGAASSALLILQKIKSGEAVQGIHGEEDLKSLEARAKGEIEKALSKSNNVNYSGGSKAKSTSGSGSKGKAEDTYLEEYKRRQAELKHQREMELISEDNYQQKSMALADDMLKGKSKYLDEYQSVEETFYKYTQDKYLSDYKSSQEELKSQQELGLISETEMQQKSMDLADEMLKGKEKYLEEYKSTEEAYYKYIRELNQKILDDVNSGIDEIQSAYSSLSDIAKEANENDGKISIDSAQDLSKMDFRFLAALSEENGQLKINEQSFNDLAKSKLQEMQITQARIAIDTINNLSSEAKATEYLTNANSELANQSLNATEALLQQSVASAKLRGAEQGKAADEILQGYNNAKSLIGQTDFNLNAELNTGNDSKKNDFEKTFNWIERLLEKLSKQTDRLTKKAEGFFSWWKKNVYVNKAMQNNQKAINANEKSYDYYVKKANQVGLPAKYKSMVQDGSINIETIKDEELADKIEQYQEWYDKAIECRDVIEELYETERSLISQKLDNILSYYETIENYTTALIAKIDSKLSLKEAMGQRTTMLDLIQKAGNELAKSESAKSKVEAYDKEFTTNKSTSEIQAEVNAIDDNLKETSGYQKLLSDIAKLESEQSIAESKGKVLSKTKQQQLKDYYALKSDLEKNATADTLYGYSQTWKTWQKYQKMIDSGKKLNSSQRTAYNQAVKDLESYAKSKQDALNSLNSQLLESINKLDSTADKESNINESVTNQKNDAKSNYDNEISGMQTDLQNTSVYKSWTKKIAALESKADKLRGINPANLTKSQAAQLQKYESQLKEYYARLESYDNNCTLNTIGNYDKVYSKWLALKKKEEKSGLTLKEQTTLSGYESQLKDMTSYKEDIKAELQKELDAKISNIEESAKQALSGSSAYEAESNYNSTINKTKKSYEDQINNVSDKLENTAQYKSLISQKDNLAAEIKGLESKEKLTKSQQDALEKKKSQLAILQQKLNSLDTGATSENITDYIKTYDAWYALEKKRLAGQSYDAKTYDTLKAKLDSYQKSKSEYINSLKDEMADALKKLEIEKDTAVADADSKASEALAEVFKIAKQIAEFDIGSLENELALIDSCISSMGKYVDLYQKLSIEHLKIYGLLEEGQDYDISELMGQAYETQHEKLKEKIGNLKQQQELYEDLINNAESGDFSSIFDKYLSDDNVSDDTKSVIETIQKKLGENSKDATEWINDWQKALDELDSDLIDSLLNIQDVKDALRENVTFAALSNALKQLNYAKDEFSDLANLVDDDLLYNDDGSFSEYGVAKVGMLVEQLQSARKEADLYAEKIQAIKDAEDTYANDSEYQAALEEARNNYRESVGDAKSYISAIVDLYKKQQEEEINALKDLTSKHKDALQAKKDYDDYDKQLRDSNKEINSLEAQIAAMEQLTDTTDAATKAKKAQLDEQLKEKQDALEDTKNEHVYKLQIDALDDLVTSLEDALNESTKNVQQTLENQKEIIENASNLFTSCNDKIKESLDKLLEFYTGKENTDVSINTPLLSTEKNNVEKENSRQEASTESLKETVSQKDDNDKAEICNSVLDKMSEVQYDAYKLLLESNKSLQLDLVPMTSCNNDLLDKISSAVSENITWQMWQPNFELPINKYTVNNDNNIAPSVQIKYDNMINIEGNASEPTILELKKTAKEIGKYIEKDMYHNLQKVGLRKK